MNCIADELHIFHIHHIIETFSDAYFWQDGVKSEAIWAGLHLQVDNFSHIFVSLEQQLPPDTEWLLRRWANDAGLGSFQDCPLANGRGSSAFPLHSPLSTLHSPLSSSISRPEPRHLTIIDLLRGWRSRRVEQSGAERTQGPGTQPKSLHVTQLKHNIGIGTSHVLSE